MFKRMLKLNKDKTNIILVVNPFQLRNIDLPSKFKLDQSDFNFSTKLRTLGNIINEYLTFKYQVAEIKK